MARRRAAAWICFFCASIASAAAVRAQIAGQISGQISGQIADLPSPFVTGTAEVWTGAEATRHSWSSYTGANWAPLGKLADDGLRLRVSGGYAEYRYSSTVLGAPTSIYGTSAFADLLVGYQMAFGALTLKAFAGASFDGHLLDPFDDASRLAGTATGAKGVVEGWLNLGSTSWAQLDLGYATAHETYNSRLRAGWRLTNTFSVGLEAGSFGNVAGRHGRGGAFARYDWLGGELSVSGGLSGDIAAPRNPYGTVMYLTRF